MRGAIGPILQRTLAASINLVVLAGLLGIGYWGHVHHWHVPKFSVVTGTTDAHATAAPAAGRVPADPFDPLPLIHFPSVEAVEKSGVTLGTVAEQRIDEYMTVNGIVTYDESRLAQLSCRVAGIVWRVEKQLGEAVRKGDILAIIDSSEVGRAKAEFLEADVNSDLAVKTLDRLRTAGNVVSERTLREAEADVRRTKVHRFNAQQALINLGLPISIPATAQFSETELIDYVHFLGLPPEVVASLDRETASANLIPLVSPLDGTVIDREIVTGEVVKPDQMQFIVADLRRMWLVLNVRKEDAAGLDVGQPVFFSTSGLPGEIESRLTWIASELDTRTRSVQVRAEVANHALDGDDSGTNAPQWQFRANMFGTGRIRIRQRPNALVVPSTAVQWNGQQHLVFIPEEDGVSFRACPVKPGVTQDGFTEVHGGIVHGQSVVVTGGYLLKSELLGVEH